MNIALLIAGGSGNRMGQDIPKQFMHVEGCPIIIRTMLCFLKHPELVELDMCQVAIDNKDFKRIKFWGAIQKLKNILAPAR